MFETRNQTCSPARSRQRHEFVAQAVREALDHYQRVRIQAQVAQFWAWITRRSRRLYSLAEIEATTVVRSRHTAATQPVPVKHIRGSDNRVRDFDSDFLPLQRHTRNRWINVWAAMYLGEDMPPVNLVQVGDVYFVQDGHHRVSVARALRMQYIDATVTVWDVAGCLPWECAPCPTMAHLPA